MMSSNRAYPEQIAFSTFFWPRTPLTIQHKLLVRLILSPESHKHNTRNPDANANSHALNPEPPHFP